MKTIEIDESVYSGLLKRVLRFGETPNDVIKRLLTGEEPTAITSPPIVPRPVDTSPLAVLIRSPEFEREDGKGRYLSILGHLYRTNPAKFAELEGLRRGSRVQISTDVETIKASGKNTMPQELPGSPYFVLTNLSHERKRVLIGDFMKQLGQPPELIALAVRSIPDSERTRTPDLSVLDL